MLELIYGHPWWTTLWILIISTGIAGSGTKIIKGERVDD